MKLENQVCTEEQGERLKELGVVQESLFYHTHSKKWGVMPRESIDFSGNPTSAFTVAELGVMLPQGYYTYHTVTDDESEYPETTWGAMDSLDRDLTYLDDSCIMAATEAKCRAAAIIHLLQTKQITVEEINQRLQIS